MKTIKCPKCSNEMTVYGITEKGGLKYHCAECYFMTVVECENKESRGNALCEKVAEKQEID